MKNLTINSLLIHDITQSDSLGYAIHTPVDGLDFPDIRLSSFQKPGEHGAIVSNQLYDARTINLTGIVWGNDIATYNAKRRALQAALGILNDANGFKVPFTVLFETDDGLLLQFDAFLPSKIKMSDELPNHANFFLTLFAPDPNLYNQTASDQTIDLATTPVSPTNLGDADTYPVITFTDLLTSPVLTNTTTGAVFKLNYALTAGHTIVVDMAAKTIVLDGTTNLMSAFDAANLWLWLVPGSNTFTLTTGSGGDTGSIDISFRDAYVGS